MRVVISGASGLVGSALALGLSRHGYVVSRLVRRAPLGEDEIAWDPESGTIDATRLEGHDAAVHLSGQSLTSGRWTQSRKQSLLTSRVGTTELLSRALAHLRHKPQVLVTASAIGYYGDRGDERLTEGSAPGQGFLSELVRAWEAASAPAETAGVRVVKARFGLILTAKGGALQRLLLPFRWGLGGPLGDGKAWWSWVSIDDVVEGIRFLIERPDLKGPFNLVAPGTVTNLEFTRALGSALSRPTLLPAPAWALRLVFGEMADQALLASLRVEPERLAQAGFRFQFPSIDLALRHALERQALSG